MTGNARCRQALWRWGPPIVWLAAIAIGSTEVLAAEETSRFIGPLLHWLFPGAAPERIALLHGLIRKCGHVTEFGVLAFLWYRAFAWNASAWSWPAAGRALAATLVCAGLDEAHQIFEPTRTASLVDVGIDILGGMGVLGARWLGSGRRDRAGAADRAVLGRQIPLEPGRE